MRATRRSVLALVLALLGLLPASALPAAAVALRPALPPVVFHGDRAERVVALTFDDGYNVAACAAILAILERDEVPATFFPVGEAVGWHPAFWRLVDADGYPIGDHSLTHPFMTRLSYADQLAQLVDSRALITGVLGHPMTPLFRPPYGAADATTLAAARAAGFAALVFWDTSAADTSLHGTPAEMIRDAERGRDGSIILLHCGPAVTPQILPAIIAWYRAAGYGFRTVPELLGLPGRAPSWPSRCPRMVDLDARPC
ncbi:MAG: polysaccharide deacetylase family protein [Candidatus Limnocylindrales bacterium]